MRFLIESLPVDPLLADEWVPAGVWVLSDERDECVVRYAEDDPPSMEAAARASEIVQAAWYRLSLMTYNLLSAFKRIGLPEKLHQVRPKRLRFRLLCLGAKIATHARRLTMRLAAVVEGVAELIALRKRLVHLPAG